MSHIIPTGRWCNIIVLNVHTPCEVKSNDIKDSFYEELGHISDQFSRYDMKAGSEDIFKSTIGNESSHKISNDAGVRVTNCATKT
jgi:hypothetical protein